MTILELGQKSRRRSRHNLGCIEEGQRQKKPQRSSLPPLLFYLGRFWRIGCIHPLLSIHPGAIHPIIQNRFRQNSQRGKELNKPNRSDDLCIFFCLYPFSMLGCPGSLERPTEYISSGWSDEVCISCGPIPAFPQEKKFWLFWKGADKENIPQIIMEFLDSTGEKQ